MSKNIHATASAMGWALDEIYATATKVAAMAEQNKLAEAIEQSLPHLLANEPHPWPIGLIKLYVLSKPDAHTLGWPDTRVRLASTLLSVPIGEGLSLWCVALPALRYAGLSPKPERLC